MKTTLITGLLLCGSLILHAKQNNFHRNYVILFKMLYDKNGSYIELEKTSPTHVEITEIYGKNTPDKLAWGFLAGLTAFVGINYYANGRARTLFSRSSSENFYLLTGSLMALSSYKWYSALCNEYKAAEEARLVAQTMYKDLNSHEPPLETYTINQEVYSLAGLYLEQHTKNIELIANPRSLVISFTQQKGK